MSAATLDPEVFPLVADPSSPRWKSPWLSVTWKGAARPRSTWAMPGHTMWGQACGDESHLFVLDVDAYKSVPVPPEVQALIDSKDTRMVRTARGGLHLVYVHLAGITNAGGWPGIVDVRGQGGYRVHECSDGYEVVHDVPPEYAPEWLIERLQRATAGALGSSTPPPPRRVPSTAQPVTGADVQTPATVAIKRDAMPDKVWDAYTHEAEEGQRSEAIFATSCAFARAGFSAEDTFTLMRANVNVRSKRWSDTNLWRDVQKAHATVLAEQGVQVLLLGALQADADTGEVVDDDDDYDPRSIELDLRGYPGTLDGDSDSDDPGPDVREEPPKPPRRHLTLIGLDDLLTRPDPTWFVEGLLMESSLALLAGEAGVGKSFFALDMAAAIALGNSWHGQTTKQGRVLYVAGEGVSGFGQRVRAWEVTNGPIDRGAFYFVEEGVNLSDAESVGIICDTVADREVDVVILDTFSQLSAVENENDAAQVAAVLRAARDVRQARPGASVLIVHHVNKGDKARVRGSSALKANVDTVMVLRRDAARGIVLSTMSDVDGKSKDAEAVRLDGFDLQNVDVPGHASSAIVVNAPATITFTPDDVAIGTVLADGQPHSMAEFLTELGDASDGARRRMQRRLQGMVTAGQVVQAGSTRTRTYERAF